MFAEEGGFAEHLCVARFRAGNVSGLGQVLGLQLLHVQDLDLGRQFAGRLLTADTTIIESSAKAWDVAESRYAGRIRLLG